VNEAALDDSARRAPACTLVIFGASGDLTERKLLPALRQLAANRRLRPEFALVGVARTEMSDEEWADRCLSGAGAVAGEIGDWASRASFRYVSGGYDDPETYRRLGEVLADCDRALGTAGQHVFYLATPPRLFGAIAVELGKSALNISAAGNWPRLVIEKPFGWDEASARSLYVARPCAPLAWRAAPNPARVRRRCRWSRLCHGRLRRVHRRAHPGAGGGRTGAPRARA
jgi:glucose-6-phosphate 1-dehydrogenase